MRAMSDWALDDAALASWMEAATSLGGYPVNHTLIVALGKRRYRIERPFGAWPKNAGHVTDVAVDALGQIRVLLRHDSLVQPDDPRVIMLGPDGTFLSGWGGTEIADSHLMTPAPDGSLWVVDRDMHEVIRFSGDGKRIGGLGRRGVPLGPFNHPSDIAVSAWGDLYVSDGYAAAHVHRFASDGTHLQTWGKLGSAPGDFAEPHSICTLPDKRIVVVDRNMNRIQFFDHEGRFLREVGDFYRPLGIYSDAEGMLYVTDLVPCLTMLTPDGERIGRCRPVLNGAHGLHGDAAGNLFLAEGNPSRITKMVRLE